MCGARGVEVLVETRTVNTGPKYFINTMGWVEGVTE